MLCLLGFRMAHHVYTCITHVAACQQRPCPGNTRRWFRQFLAIYHRMDKGRGRGGRRVIHKLQKPLPHATPQRFPVNMPHREKLSDVPKQTIAPIAPQMSLQLAWVYAPGRMDLRPQFR